MSTMRTDHTIPGRSRRRDGAAALLVVGAVLLVVSVSYYTYAALAKAGVDDLNVEFARPEGFSIPTIDAPPEDDVASPVAENEDLQTQDVGESKSGPTESTASHPVAVSEITLSTSQVTAVLTASSGDDNAVQTAAETDNVRVPSGSADLGAGAAISPETLESLNAAVATLASTEDPWVLASTAEVALYTPVLTDGMVSGALMPATRIRIPALDLDSRVAELGVVRSDDSASWETPKHVVGHIPTTANAGSGGQGWYFGHLESPIKGEGSVFRRLPEVATLLKDDPDRPVYVFLESGDRSFAYRIYNVEVVSQEELAIADSGAQDITLVTCTPRFVYDQRLLVTAALVGVLES